MEHFTKSSENRAHCAALAESSQQNFSVVCFPVHRACHGVVGFTMNDGMKDCEVLISGDLPQRAKAMKSKDGHLTYSGKSKCTTSHSAQLKARVGEREGGTCEPCPFDLRASWLIFVWRRLCTCEANRGVVDSARTASSNATAASLGSRCGYDFRYRGCCVKIVNVDVPLDSVLVQVAVRCPSFVLCFCGAALVQTPRDSGVVCVSLCSWGP